MVDPQAERQFDLHFTLTPDGISTIVEVVIYPSKVKVEFTVPTGTEEEMSAAVAEQMEPWLKQNAARITAYEGN